MLANRIASVLLSLIGLGLLCASIFVVAFYRI